jgi:hypothetical protein
MNQSDANEYIKSRISVTRQKVTIAKSTIFQLCKTIHQSSNLIDEFLETIGAVMPSIVVIHNSVDPIPVLKKCSESISWRIAGSEAIWELIHSNLLIQTSPNIDSKQISVSWTTIVPGSGGQSSSWRFSEYSLPYPSKVSRPLSLTNDSEDFLSNHDLYLAQLNVNAFHPDVESSLREAVECFRYELYTASLAMLGKAVEGSWLDLGESLIDSLPSNFVSSVRNIKDRLENPHVGIGKKIEDVVSLYERQDIFGQVTDQSGVSLNELRMAAAWSNIVRESRNSIHFGVESSTPNTYEKIAALLLGAVPHIQIIYRLVVIDNVATNV